MNQCKICKRAKCGNTSLKCKSSILSSSKVIVLLRSSHIFNIFLRFKNIQTVFVQIHKLLFFFKENSKCTVCVSLKLHYKNLISVGFVVVYYFHWTKPFGT